MSLRPRWLREQDRWQSEQLDRIYDLVDHVWVDQFQLMRNFGVRSSVELPHRESTPAARPSLRVVSGGAS